MLDWQVPTLTCVCHSECLIDRCRCWLVSVTVTVWLTCADADLCLSLWILIDRCRRWLVSVTVTVWLTGVNADLCLSQWLFDWQVSTLTCVCHMLVIVSGHQLSMPSSSMIRSVPDCVLSLSLFKATNVPVLTVSEWVVGCSGSTWAVALFIDR